MGRSLVGIVATENSMVWGGFNSLLKESQNFGKISSVSSLDDLDYCLRTEPATKLLIVDLSIIGFSDMAYLHHIRAQFPSLYIVAISASFEREMMIDALSAGMHGYIPANLSYREISSALASVLSGNVYVPAMAASIDPNEDSEHPVHSNIVPLRPAMIGMSTRQQQVLRLIANGDSNKSIARKLKLSEGTVKTHVAAVFQKMGVHNRVAAAAMLSKGLNS
jgi:DNA-binding NarL/FixJ family response regulator